MAYDKYNAQRREIRYGTRFFNDLAVAELNPRASETADQYQELLLRTRSAQIAHCAMQSWRSRRVRSRPEMRDIERQNANDFGAMRFRTQYDRVANPRQKSRYIVALHGVDESLRVQDKRRVTAYARVESWRANKGFGRFFGARFPMITELESVNGELVGGKYAEDVAAVVSHALTESPSDAQAGLRVYEQDQTAIAFFQELGMSQRGHNQVEGYAGAWTVDMVTDPDVTRVQFQQELAERFPILQRSMGY